MLIHVTQKHIDEGKRGNCGSCPVSLAISETIKHAVSVSGHRWRRCGPGCAFLPNEVSKPLSDDVSHWISVFDRGYSKKPFSFEIEV